MGSLALLAREMGHQVSGCDANVYPPMSTQLQEQGIHIYQGYDSAQFEQKPDLVIIGNALSRGNEAVEYVLNKQLPYTSGPQWLSQNLLEKRWVLAVAGTHGKTTTTSMLAWILEDAGYKPGFLIGGVPGNFSCSARLGESDFFVIEADEYDTAFFDKRSKFLHYHPRTLVMNNLEFDHADIFPDMAAIQKQFEYLLRLVPSQGLVIYPEQEHTLGEVVEKGLWSEAATLFNFNASDDKQHGNWVLKITKQDASEFEIIYRQAIKTEQQVSQDRKEERHKVIWNLIGEHNARNAFAACVAAHHVGVPLAQSCQSLMSFRNVKRRLEHLAELNTKKGLALSIYDDFAHHPSAIQTTLQGLRKHYSDDYILAVLEPRSNTMKMGVHGDSVREASETADQALWFIGDNLSLASQIESEKNQAFQSMDALENHLLKQVQQSQKNIRLVFMSNGAFSGIQQRFIAKMKEESTL